jgi:hypothetical protein
MYYSEDVAITILHSVNPDLLEYHKARRNISALHFANNFQRL